MALRKGNAGEIASFILILADLLSWFTVFVMHEKYTSIDGLRWMFIGIKPPFSLLLIDVDNFKSVNDTYGHIIGDSVLRQFAHLLRSKARKDYILARWGGEEYVMALPRTGVDDALYIADGIRKAVQEHRFCCQGITCNITVSIGIASISRRANINDIEQFFVRADKALY